MIDLRLPVRALARPDDPDPEAVRLVQETRQRIRGLTRRETWTSLVVGGGFLAAAIPFALLQHSQRSASAVTVIALVAAYAIAYRVEFEIAAGSVVATELVLVPMLFLLPLGVVPLVVAAAIVCARLPLYLSGRAPIMRVGADLVSSWHAIGPAVVLAAAGEHAPALAHWQLYLAALAAQFVADFGAGTLYQALAHGISPRTELRFIAAGFGVDAALAPVGLVVAIVAQEHALYFLLVLPLVGLLAAFARQRRSAIDGALALSSAYRGAAELLVDFGVDPQDAYTGEHSRQIVELVLEVADEMGVDSRGRRDAELAALLHDVGKMRVPRALIQKPAALTAEERALIETHTIEGQEMLGRVGGLLGNVGNIVRSCHERWDGGGYPDGLGGEEIPLVARIVACCDAYNAMTTDRPYRLALAADDALYELRVHAGTQFDPAVVDALVRVLARTRAVALAG